MSVSAPFRVGDKVVYPNHGVGVIEHITRRTDGGSSQEFYLLRIEASNLRVMVPFGNAASVGMRAVSAAAEAVAVLQYLEQTECVSCSPDWKGRFRENSGKMRNGTLAEIAEVLKGLVQLHQAKPLSFREKKMLDRAVVLLTAELASASDISQEASLELIQRALAHAKLILPPPDPES